MADFRVKKHPILSIPNTDKIEVFWKGQKLAAQPGETIASALFANGIRVFGHHPKDGSPQGIFCANGQCSQCMVIANGIPVKACMAQVLPGMDIQPVDGLPILPETDADVNFTQIPRIKVPVLIIGGGPAGLSAGIELGKLDYKTLIVDDKARLGGKLVLQTHRFFGSTQAVYAGTRGIDIATRLENEIRTFSSVDIWLNSTALSVFSDRQVGIIRNNLDYVLVEPEIILVATGAREKFLAFEGNTLPGVYGAGAFQTLVNRDLVRPSGRLFIVGGGNVGLIAGYHALQADITVVGLVEALPECGGYRVHRDKLARMGVPIYTSHTVHSANGTDAVESITISQVDNKFKAIPGTERTFACDSILIAVGLDPVNEFYNKAKDFGIPVYSAGDAEEIAEASAAIFSGKIKGLEISRSLGSTAQGIPDGWYQAAEILKSKPGDSQAELLPEIFSGVTPVLHCVQEIPCDPCSMLCAQGLIQIDENDIRSIPVFVPENGNCVACRRCVIGCPGLAITLVDYRKDPAMPLVSIPYEFNADILQPEAMATVLDMTGNELGILKVKNVLSNRTNDRTLIIQFQAPTEYARKIAGIRIQPLEKSAPLDHYMDHIENDIVVCRCERVTAGEVRALIRKGYRDMNEIKTVLRAGMGACGGKTCSNLIFRIFREEGVAIDQITGYTQRPLFIEVPIATFAGMEKPHVENHDQ